MPRTRLRRTFQYPDSDSDSDPNGLDEEHQERLIASLQTRDASKTQLYRTAYLSIPLLAALFFLTQIFSPSPTAKPRARLVALLSFSSLICTAYILHFIPLEISPSGPKSKKAILRMEGGDKSPVEQFLPWLNAALAGVIMISAVGSWSRGARDDAWREALPAIILGLTMLVRQQLAPLDLEDLQQARYEFKGA